MDWLLLLKIKKNSSKRIKIINLIIKIINYYIIVYKIIIVNIRYK